MSAILDKSTGNVDVTCDTCGKPITHSNEFGMFCKDNCGLAESKVAKKRAMDMIGDLSKLFAGGLN